MRTIARTAGVSIDAGEFCASYHGATVRNVTAKRIQCDEAWAFVYAKQKNVETAKAAPEFAGACGPGRPWTPTASWSSYAVGGRDAGVAYEFMHDLKDRLANRVQLTTDGHAAYLEAVEDAFGGAIDYAMLVKVYGEAQRKRGAATARPSARASTRSDRGRPRPGAHLNLLHRALPEESGVREGRNTRRSHVRRA